MKKNYKKTLSIVLSLVLIFTLLSSVSVSAAGDKIGRYDYTISNPYASVDWDTWKAYSGATHVHTVRSDGDVELDDMIEHYYSLGYDDLALTDHGTVNYSWTKNQNRLAIFGYQYFVHGNIDEISNARYQQITTGSDRGGRGMIEVPLGIELNGSSAAKCHVNSYYADCGHGDLELTSTWPEDAIKKSQKANGICHINHVGEWTDGKDNIGTYDAAFIQKFAGLFTNYSSCIGMELVNTSDNRTHNDRYLYDETLKITAPQGVNVWGFCEDDSHEYSDCGRNAQYFMMPSNTAENVRTSMTNGTFFACSKNAKTADELGDGFAANGEFPMVSKILVDESTDQISINAYNGTKIKMVSNGVVVAEKAISYDNQTVVFDLNEYENIIGSYVRFFITGAGGICYIQPFLLAKSTYSQSTVQFNLPSTDTALTVKDINGTTIAPSNSDNYYSLAAGTYTYTAERSGYQTKTESFTVTSAQINAGTQIKINVTLDVDAESASVYFYVPETIYLKPATGTMNTFQYYVDRANQIDGALTNDAADTSGNIYFCCDKATSVTIKADSVASTATNGSINFINGYTVNGSTAATQITAGALASALSAGSGTVITWTATYTLQNGGVRNAYAYSYVYAPYLNEAAAGMRQVHTYSTDVFNQGILYMAGFNSVTGGTYTCTKNFFTDSAPTSSTGIAGWFTSAANGGVDFVNKSHSSNASDSHTATGGTGTVYVDSSRVTNLNQLPNLRIGFWQCDIDGDSSATCKITQIVDGNTTTLKNSSTGVGSAYSAKINYANANGQTGTKSIKISAYTQTLRGNRQNNNYYNIKLNVNYVNKDVLRLAYNNAIRLSANETNLSAAYLSALRTAGTVLGNPTATAANVTTAVNNLNAVIS